jgi:hypothetical protein
MMSAKMTKVFLSTEIKLIGENGETITDLSREYVIQDLAQLGQCLEHSKQSFVLLADGIDMSTYREDAG